MIAIYYRYATLKRSAREANLVLFTDERIEALEQSVSVLNLSGDIFSVQFFFFQYDFLVEAILCSISYSSSYKL